MQRRAVLKSVAAVALTSAAKSMISAPGAPISVIDSHIHLFDTTRPGGVPWPEKSDSVLYHPALPGALREIG